MPTQNANGAKMHSATILFYFFMKQFNFFYFISLSVPFLRLLKRGPHSSYRVSSPAIDRARFLLLFFGLNSLRVLSNLHFGREISKPRHLISPTWRETSNQTLIPKPTLFFIYKPPPAPSSSFSAFFAQNLFDEIPQRQNHVRCEERRAPGGGPFRQDYCSPKEAQLWA